MRLHALEDDDAATGRVDLVLLDVEGSADAEMLYLVLDQQFARLFQRVLDFMQTDPAQTGTSQTVDGQQLGKKVRLAAAATAKCALVPRRLNSR